MTTTPSVFDLFTDALLILSVASAGATRVRTIVSHGWPDSALNDARSDGVKSPLQSCVTFPSAAAWRTWSAVFLALFCASLSPPPQPATVSEAASALAAIILLRMPVLRRWG